MPILQVIVLAVVQGLTEFLPVSSTAHLYLTSWLLGWQTEALDFDIALHIGTLLAIVLYFFRDWLQIVAQGFGMRYGRDEELKRNRMMLWLLAIGTIPVGVFGYVFNKQAETTWRNPFVMGAMLVAVGVVMWLAERAGRKRRDLSSLNLPDAVVIGLAQALAVVPGTSRSGITICRRPVPRSRPRIGRALFLSALHARPSPPRPARRSTTCTSPAACRHPAQRPFLVGRGGERDHRLCGDRLVPALPPSQQPLAVCVLPHNFWHNSDCSGFHPPASVMKLLSPTEHRRLNEVTGFLLLSLGLVWLLSLVSYHAQDPSWNTAAAARPLNLIGYPGAYLADFLDPDFRLGAASCFRC